MSRCRALATALGFCALIAGGVSCSEKGKPFPLDSLVVEKGTFSSSLRFNPYSDYPPKLRWEIGVSFQEMLPPGAEKPDTPFISYTVDLNISDWKSLQGGYRLGTGDGSDMWISGMNYGLVDLQKITIKPAGGSSFDIVLDLVFHFDQIDETRFRKEKRSISFRTEYEGLSFLAPMWNEPSEVKFPAEWKIPSTDPHWSDEAVREFVSRHVDLSTFDKVTIDQSKKYTVLEAKP